eukprot:10001175-Alexandrium_andersonii.AAC.1
MGLPSEASGGKRGACASTASTSLESHAVRRGQRSECASRSAQAHGSVLLWSDCGGGACPSQDSVPGLAR